MRIGIMLRSLDERGGIGVYTRCLTEELLAIDRRNHYVLFYRNPANLGRFAQFPNVTERVVRGRSKAVWDQWAIPLACWRERIDVLFHPKFTLPLLAPCPAVIALHGADWFLPEQAQFYKPWDVLYVKVMMPLYLWKASRAVSVSQMTTDDFNRVLRLPPGKIQTIYIAAAKHMRPISDPAVLEAVKRRYDLPQRFILTLSGYDRGRRKNIDRLIAAYRLVHGRTPHELVIGGRDCEKFRLDYAIPEQGYGAAIRFPGWIDQQDLPAVYSLADLFLFPSRVESFGIPLVEAMVCGTPIVASDMQGLREIAGDAAVAVDADDPRAIAEAVLRVLGDPALRESLRARGFERARSTFSYKKCARETLAVLEEVGKRGHSSFSPAQ